MGSPSLQGALWGAEARLWSETLEPITRPLLEQVLDELGIGGDTRLLDAGCGTGLALQIAAGRGAEVAGIDDAVRAHLSAGPARRAIEHSGRKATADAIRASLECSVQPDGTSAHRNAFRYLIATA